MNGFEKHKIKHLSASSLNLWINCPAVWVAEKIFGHRGAPSPAMHRGITVEDATVAVLAKGKTIETAVRSATEKFDRAIFIGDEKSAKERDMIAPMVEQSVKALAPLGEPEFPEVGQNKIELVCNCGDFKLPVIGYLDLFYPQHGRVVDLKTTQRMPSRMSPEHRLQRAVYARAKRNHEVQFLYVTPAKATFLADGDLDAELARIKMHVRRLETFLRLLDAEQMRACVPLCDTSFYFNGSTALTDVFGAPPP